jgi:putative flippase GtrA
VTVPNTNRGLRVLLRESVAFTLVGGGRTAISLGIYLIGCFFLPYWLAFTTAFVIGITFSAFMNAKFVFYTKITVGTALRYATVYVLNYSLSLLLLFAIVEGVGVATQLAPIPVLVIMFPINFVAERIALKGRSPRPADECRTP